MSSRSVEYDFANKRRRICSSPSPSAHSQRAARVQNGLQNAVFPTEIFAHVFKYLNSPLPHSPYPLPLQSRLELDRSHILPLTLLCKGLQSEGERVLYHSITLGTVIDSSHRCHILLQTLQDRPELRSYVKSLNFLTNDVDTRASVYLEITRLCTTLDILHFHGTNAYDMSQMRCSLAQIDPTVFSLRAGRSLPYSVNNIQMVFAYIHGWKNIRQLDIGFGLLHLPAPGVAKSGASHSWRKPRLPIQYLGSIDADWTVNSLKYLQEVDLPDLILFGGGLLADMETLSALADCLPLWSSTLTTLILELPEALIGHEWTPSDTCGKLSDCIRNLPHLRTLTASPLHILPPALLTMASLEDLSYMYTEKPDLVLLALGLREPARDGSYPMPALRRFATWCNDFEHARDAHYALREVLEERDVEYFSMAC